MRATGVGVPRLGAVFGVLTVLAAMCPAPMAARAAQPSVAARTGDTNTIASEALRPDCSGEPASDPLALPAGAVVPSSIPRIADPVRAVALQHYQAIADVTDEHALRARIDCEMRLLVLPLLLPGHANVVVANEYTGLEVFALGERGAAARAFAQTAVGRGALDVGGVPTAAAAGLALVASAYAPAFSYYHLGNPAQASVHDFFLAATDTFVRGFLLALRDAAAKYSALARAPVYLVGSAPMPTRWHVELRSATSPAQFLADCQALYHTPSACLSDPPDRLYIADESAVYNVAFVVGPRPSDPDHPWIGLQRKVNLVTLEGPSFLDLTPGSMADVQPIPIPGTLAKLGIAISLDAFEQNRPCSDADPTTFVACLDARGANVFVQPEANDALTPEGSWADYIDTSQDTTGGRNPQWQPLTWMDSAWLTVADPRFHFAYAINSFMTGNLLDLAFDGQSAIFSRGGTHCGHYVGNSRFLGPYPNGGPDEAPFAVYAGDKPQFLALAPWVIPDDDRTILRQRARAMAPGSGSPVEDDYRETAIGADLVLSQPAPAPQPCDGGAGGVAGSTGAGGPTSAPVGLGTLPATAGSTGAAAAVGAGLVVAVGVVAGVRRRSRWRRPFDVGEATPGDDGAMTR